MEHTKEFMESLPTPKYKYNQDVLVVRGGEIEVRQITGVYIDAVGRGYDGREVSKGLDCHERYFIPWFDVRKCNLSNFKNYRTYLVNEDDYKMIDKYSAVSALSILMDGSDIKSNDSETSDVEKAVKKQERAKKTESLLKGLGDALLKSTSVSVQ